MKSKLLSILLAYADLAPYRISRELEQWARDFRPDLLYTPLGNIRVSRLALALSERLGCPLLVHFMDDWLTTLYADTRLKCVPRKQLASLVGKAVRLASGVVCISDAMAEEYRERFKRPCEAFSNCADLRKFALADRRSDQGLRFAYVGGLHLDRWRSLKEIGDALSRASAGNPVPAQLLIHAPAEDLEQYGAALGESPGILLAEPLAPTEVPGALSRSDVLVHVESFRPEVMAYCRLSLSTKIPQYLAAGRPVLCYGPAALASSQYILRLGAGIVVGEQNTAALTAAVVRLRDDCQLRHRLGANARAAAETHHDARAQRERFQALLHQAAKNTLADATTVSSRAGVSA